MGRVADSYGVRGWVKAAPDAGAAAGLANVPEWSIDGRAYKVVQARVHGATVVAKLEGLESREQALALKGKRVNVQREALPDPGEGHYYLADLVGLEVVNEQGEVLGRIARMFSSGAQDVMELGEEGKGRLLPWVPAVVKDVDLERGRVTVAWGADW